MYILAHKDRVLGIFDSEEKHGYAKEISSFIISKENIDYLPLPLKRIIHYKKEFIDSETDKVLITNEEGCFLLDVWLDDRAIPFNRYNLSRYIERGKTPKQWMLSNNAFSFVDHYWIMKEGSHLSWNEVKEKYNDTDEFFMIANNPVVVKYKGHNSTLGGELEKFWYRENNQLCLAKKVTENMQILAVREIVASLIYSRLNVIDYCDYSLFQNSNLQVVGCRCKSFLNDGEELITAYDLLEEYNYVSLPDTVGLLLKLTSDYDADIKGVQKYLDVQTIIDFLIMNKDRHLGNIGFIRDSETLQITRCVPVYDSGSSASVEYDQEIDKDGMKVNSFEPTDIECFNTVSDYNVVDVSKLPDAKEIYQIYQKYTGLSESRIQKLTDLYNRRCDLLKKYQRQ